ncbi:Rne/Rng family ribonuclease [Humitalea rosea]|uniref:Rne/Rng family ribonuclease n=1 Tax=Humitalea rosea TaxID=990373 RepID=A0A2W7IFI9_9PROT|nr:ribonuclease E/G [Humitalea rosea]PZW44848.1 Rne/Rng family ribonuclease [Humitalea rosea]
MILVSLSPGERRVALWQQGRLTGAWIERPARPDGVDDVLLGRISALAPAMAGCFVALPDDETGFLPDSEARGLNEGSVLAVRVIRAAQGGKGPRLSAKVPPGTSTAGTAPQVISRGPDAALRLAKAFPGMALATDDAAEAARLRAILGLGRVGLIARAFDAEAEEEFAALAEAEVELPGGGRLTIQTTRALTAIDVDAGSASGRDAGAARALNLAALAEAARQIRLRHLAGAILLDPAGMPARARAALLPSFEAALKPDPLSKLVGLSGLGLIEVRRARVHPPLHELLSSPLGIGLAALRAAARQARAEPGFALALRARPAVIDALRDLPGALEAYEAGAGRPLVLRPDSAAMAPVIEDADA